MLCSKVYWKTEKERIRDIFKADYKNDHMKMLRKKGELTGEFN